MRRQLLLATACAASAAALLTGAAPAAGDAGPHHASAGIVTDTCAGCHRAHTAQAPGLLKEAQTSLCYACHGSGAPGSAEDVVNGVGYGGGSSGALRGGGFQFALIDSDNPSGHDSGGVIPVLSVGEGEEETSTHSVDSSEQTAWGFGAISGEVNYGETVSLSCGNCHDPHGNGNYRILRSTPKGVYHYPEHGPEVAIPDTATKVYTTENYWRSDDVNALGFAENIAAWCSICHTRYSADHEGSTYSGDPVYSYRHTSDDDRQGGGRRTCIQCHVSHGSNASMGTRSNEVPSPDGSLAAGDSRLLRVDSRGVCKLCHEEK